MKKILTLIIILSIVISATGCVGKGKKGEKEDPNKTQIYVSIFDGGFGVDWIQEAAKRFNAKEENQEYQVMIKPNYDAYYSKIEPNITTNTTLWDIFLTNTANCKELAIGGYLEDLTDIYSMKVDEDNKTIEEKIIDVQDFKTAYGNNGKIYGLPYTESTQGFIFDFDMFKENGYLFTNADGSLTVGKDSVAGTYDDGQPTTFVEWTEMLEKISQDMKRFIWTGKYSDYLNSIFETVWAQYEGIENYKLSYMFEGDYTSPTTKQKTTLTTQDGYKIFNISEGRKKGVQFVYDHLVKDSGTYCNSYALIGDTSHRDAQDYFIQSYENSATNPETAFLVEGMWWENEAKPMFTSLTNRGKIDRGFGKRDYRFMLYPTFDNQIGGNGDGTGSVMPISENGTIFLKKQSNSAKTSKAKEFIAYLCSDEVCKLFTLKTGGLRPFEMTLTADEKAQLTPFGRSAYEMYQDKENVKFIRYNLYGYYSVFNMQSPSVSRWRYLKDGSMVLYPYTALLGLKNEDDPVTAYQTKIYDYNYSRWSQILNATKL